MEKVALLFWALLGVDDPGDPVVEGIDALPTDVGVGDEPPPEHEVISAVAKTANGTASAFKTQTSREKYLPEGRSRI